MTFDFQKEKRKAREEAQRELSITRRIAKLSKQCTISEIQEKLVEEFALSYEQAKEACRKVFED